MSEQTTVKPKRDTETDWMKKCVIHFLQKEYDTVLLFAGILLLFYLGMNLVRTYALLQSAVEPKYLYRKDYFSDRSWTEAMMEQAVATFDGTGDNFMLRGVNASVGYTNDSQEILLYLSAEALAKREKIDLEGWNRTQNSVLIEGRLKQRCYFKNGRRWIIISGLEFPVFGVIEENEILAQSVHLNWKNLDEERRQMYLERQEFYLRYDNGIPIQIQSLTKFGDEVERFEADFGSGLRVCEAFREYASYEREDIYHKMKILYYIMELFGVFSTYYLVEVWFTRRKREFLIRRMLGSSVFRIWGVALREAGTATGLAFICAAVIEFFQMSLHVAGTLGTKEILLILTGSLLITVAIEAALFGVHLWRIIKINPTQQNIESMA